MYKLKTDYLKIIKELKKRGEVFSATNDSVFKSLIQDEDLKDYTAFLISNCNGKILNGSDIVFINTEDTKKTIVDKINVHDILIECSNGRISLEMNKYDNKKLRNRNIAHYYSEASKTINLSYIKGREMQYEQINFDDFNNGNNLVSIYKIVNIETGKEDPYENNFVKYRLNLALVYEKYYNYNKELTRFEKALVILTLNKIKDLRKVAKGDEMLMRVVKKIEELSENPDLVMYIDDEKAMEFGHKLDIEDAHREGIKQKAIETAKKMLDKKMDINDIIDVTGLSLEEIKKLQ